MTSTDRQKYQEIEQQLKEDVIVDDESRLGIPAFAKRVARQREMSDNPMKKINETLRQKKAILDNFKQINKNNQKFAYIQLDTHMLKSAFTDANGTFQQCTQFIEQYNKDIKECIENKKDILDGLWKNAFYGTLQNLLLEIRFTKNRTLQEAFIEKVHEWATFQLKTQTKKKIHNQQIDKEAVKFNFKTLRTKRSTTGHTSIGGGVHDTTQMNVTQGQGNASFLDQTGIQDQTQLNLLQSNNNLVSTTQIKSQENILDDLNVQQQPQPQQNTIKAQEELIPSEMIKDTLRDYQNKYRTQHKEMDPPSFKLNQYKHKEFVNRNVAQEEQDVINVQGQINYPKPEIDMPSDEPAPQPEQQENPEDQNEGKNDEELLTGIDGADKIIQKQEELKQAEEQNARKFMTVPKTRNFLNDENSKHQFNNDLNMQYEIRSNFVNYEPSKNVKEWRMHKKWEENRHKELIDKRNNEEYLEMMNNWAVNKGRMEKEINRRYDSKAFGTNFQECEYRPKQYGQQEVKELVRNAKITQKEEEELQKQKEEEEERLKKEAEIAKFEDANNNTQQSQRNISYNNSTNQQMYTNGSQNSFKKNNSRGSIRPVRQQKSYSMHGPRDVQAKVVDHSGFLPQIAKKEYRAQSREKFSGIEREMNNLKIQSIKRQYGNLIGLQPTQGQKAGGDDQDDTTSEEPQKVVTQPSLSVYAKLNRKVYRPFSSVFEIIDRQKVRDEQLEEIQEIKNRMAKHKINVPIKKLMDSMVIPEQIIGPKAEKLPEPGMMLMEDLFAAKPKAKKKKK